MKQKRKQSVPFVKTRYFSDPTKVPSGIEQLHEDVSNNVNLWIDEMTYGNIGDLYDCGNVEFEVLSVTPLTNFCTDGDGHIVGATHSQTVVCTLAPNTNCPKTEELTTPSTEDCLLSLFDAPEVGCAIADLNGIRLLTERLIESASYALTANAQDIKDLGVFVRSR